ncbi:hypothetical protein AAHB36_12540 [Bacillus velezensis]
MGVVTSPTGAAVRDVITTLKRRYPPCESHCASRARSR